MGVLSIIILILGILMLIEGGTVVFFPKYVVKIFRRWAKGVEKNIKAWGIGEIIVALVLIVVSLKVL